MPKNWMYVGKLLNFKEKMAVFLLGVLIFASLIFWVNHIYRQFTTPIPKRGGEYIEGLLGQPLYINPLLSQANEVDASLSELVYSSLLKYDSEGRVTKDLASDFSIPEDSKVYTIKLRDDLKWHDGKALTADDVVFTVNILQNPAYRSPLRQNWLGVDARKEDDRTVVFTLGNPYFGFLDNLTVGILPKHIWENITPEKFSLVEFNLQPVGSGPYSFSGLQKDSEGNIFTYKIQEFPEYYGDKPFIPRLTFNFYIDDDALINAYNKKEVLGMGRVSPDRIKDIKITKSTSFYSVGLPHYFSVFLNKNKSVALGYDEVRQALAFATDRNKIIHEILNGRGEVQDSIFTKRMDEYNSSIEKYEFNLDRAGQLLEEKGWKMNGEGIREKDGSKLEFKLYTLDSPELVSMANILVSDWKKIGAGVEVVELGVFDLKQNYIRPREYEALIFGQALVFNPDPYSFWHSSQKKDPGLNLSLFENKDVDNLLEKGHQEMDEGKRKEYYNKVQEAIAQESPAIFLYSPQYVYAISNRVQGVDIKNVNAASYRFSDVDKWYIKTKRIWKK